MARLSLIVVFSILCFPIITAASAPIDYTNKVVILRVESVGAEVLGLAAGTKGDNYVRVVATSGNGKFLVAIRSNAGILRMQGAFLDSALVVQDGLFPYYHPNGRLESEGRYVVGIKSGTWVRYGVDGAKLSERNYIGRSVDELVQGKALPSTGTVNPEQTGGEPVGTGRRQSTPIGF